MVGAPTPTKTFHKVNNILAQCEHNKNYLLVINLISSQNQTLGHIND
jgi:hypothetical protein